MATTVVRKGANRASHAAKTRRHAQRTPLPPKGVTELLNTSLRPDAADAIAEELETQKAAKKTAAARKSGARKTTTAKTAEEKPAAKKAPAAKKTTTRKAAEPKAPAAKKAAPAKKATPAKKAAPAKPAEKAADPLLAKSMHKAQLDAEVARAAGWDVDVVQEDGPSKVIVVAVKRIEEAKVTETVTVTYNGGFLDHAQRPLFIVRPDAGEMRKVLLKNSSEFRRQVTEPDDERPISRKVKRPGRPAGSRKVREDEAEESPRVDFAKLSDEEVLNALRGKRITWRNTAANVLMDGVIPARTTVKNFFITTNPRTNERIVNFNDANTTQYRSVYVHKILRAE